MINFATFAVNLVTVDINLVNLAMLTAREVDQLDSVMEKIGKMIADPYRSLDNCEDVLALMSDERFGCFLFLPCSISFLQVFYGERHTAGIPWINSWLQNCLFAFGAIVF